MIDCKSYLIFYFSRNIHIRNIGENVRPTIYVLVWWLEHIWRDRHFTFVDIVKYSRIWLDWQRSRANGWRSAYTSFYKSPQINEVCQGTQGMILR